MQTGEDRFVVRDIAHYQREVFRAAIDHAKHMSRECPIFCGQRGNSL